MHSLPATRNTTGADPHTVSGVCLSVDGVPTFLLPWRQRLQGGLTRLRDFSSSCIAPSSAVVPCIQLRCMDTQRIQLHTLHSASVPVNIPYIRKPLLCGQAPRATAHTRPRLGWKTCLISSHQTLLYLRQLVLQLVSRAAKPAYDTDYTKL
jgi:hypothetical protein